MSVAFSPDGSGADGVVAEQAPSTPATPAPARPDYIPETFWKADAGQPDLEGLAKGYSELAAFKAEQDARLTGLPEAPDKYALTLPDDFKLPDGMKFDFPADSPLVKAVQQFAFDNKLPANAVQSLTRAHVEATLAELDAAQKSIQEAHGRLGDKAADRIGAVENFAKANLGKEEADALVEALHTGYGDRIVTAMEKLIASANGVVPGANPPGSAVPASDDRARRMFPSMKK